MAAAEARVAAQAKLVGELAQAGRDTTEARRTLTILRRMSEIERAERQMWSKLVLTWRRVRLPLPASELRSSG